MSDLLRISDARMSGTSDGAVVLHVAPESAVGGPLALVQTGDRIPLDVAARMLDVVIDDAEFERRRAAWTPPARKDQRGYRQLYEDHVLQANEGCDLDFLRGRARGGSTCAPAMSPGSEEHVKYMVERIPLKRVGHLKEVVALLASEACSFCTGAVFDLSGGRAAY